MYAPNEYLDSSPTLLHILVRFPGTSDQHYNVKTNNLGNNSGTTHHDSLQGSYWADHNEVSMTSLQRQ